MATILLVEDDSILAQTLSYALETKGYQVVVAKSLREGREKLTDWLDLVILDINLPDGLGYELCREIRESGDLPVLFLTARDSEEEIVKGLTLGGDDYMTKPFGMKEWMARVERLLRPKRKAAKWVSEDLVLDLSRGDLFRKGEPIGLTAQEFRLVHHFMKSYPNFLTRRELLEIFWDAQGDFVNDNALTVTISRLRQKVEEDPKNPKYIQTVRGLGYRFGFPVKKR